MRSLLKSLNLQLFDRRLLAQIDWALITTTALLAVIGLMTIYSATYTRSLYYYDRHTLWMMIATIVFIAAIIVDYSLLERFAYFIYGFSILLLLAALFLSPTVAGTHRWISLGFISFQPSEFAKLALIIMLAKHLSGVAIPKKGLDLKGLVKPVLILIFPFILIAREPDLGTALTLFLISTSMILVAKVSKRTIIGILLAFSPLIPLGWSFLKDYQKARILSFFQPSSDTLGSGYHLMQSKIAIGSGGFIGKGYMDGTQGSLSFLPEHHTDFIFPILAEEWGFIGSLVLISLFFLLIQRGLNTARNSKDRFGFFVALGISAMLFWHVTINLAMVCGLMPVVGMPLPFLSYGGSFLVTAFVGIGIIVNIGMRRFIF